MGRKLVEVGFFLDLVGKKLVPGGFRNPVLTDFFVLQTVFLGCYTPNFEVDRGFFVDLEGK